MHYNYFADKDDKLAVLDFIFNETDLRIFESASGYEKEIHEYKSRDEIAAKYDLTKGGKFAVCFQLWSSRHKGNPIFRKIDLNPKHCEGHLFRYATEGLGMIQLYFGGVEANVLNQSHIGHFNEKSALKSARPDDSAASWNWNEIQVTSRKLKYHIHNRLAIRKIGSLGVLAGADELSKQGIDFR